MDTTKDMAERIKQRFQAYRERHDEMHSRYAANLPIVQARDIQDAQQILQRCRTQPQKAAKTKQFDAQKQVKSGIEQNDSNVGFNNNNEVMKVPHKRGYEQFNGTNGMIDDNVNKMARMTENSSSFPQQQHQQNQQQKVSQANHVRKSPFDIKTTVQPNINPFQNQQQQSQQSQHQPQKFQLNNPHACASAANTTTQANSTSTKNLSNQPVSENSTNRSVTKVESTMSPANIKNELISSNCVSSPVNLMHMSQNDSMKSSNEFDGDATTPNRGFDGDLDNLNSYELFGEITGNTSRKPIKNELDKTNVCSPTPPTSFHQNLSQHPNTWKDISKPNESPTINLNSTSTVSSIATANNTNNPLSNLINTQQQHLPATSNITSKISSMTSLSQNINTNTNMTPLSSLNQMASNVQNTRQNSAPTSLMNNMNTLMNNSRPNQIVSGGNQQNLINKGMQNNRPQNEMVSTSSIQSSTLNMNMTQQNTMNNSQANVPSSYPPPNLQRTPNLRQQIADRFKSPQQNQSPILQNMQNMGNPFIQAGGPSTAAKLHGFLLKKREQERLQLQMQQQQLQKTPFVSHGMMPSNPMQQSPYSFSNDFSNFNQMGMQSVAAQQNMASYYQQMYGIENGTFPAAPTGPPGYNQANRAYFRNFMRDRQINEMYNSAMGNMRPQMNQNVMFSTPAKAPPQYQPNNMQNALNQTTGLDAQQQMMIGNNAAVGNGAMQSRLSHFSQPDSMQMNPAMRMRPGTINTMGRYPTPPTLSRPDNMAATNQFDSQFSNTAMSGGNIRLMNNTPSPQQQTQQQAYKPTNWTPEQQQHMLLLRKQRMEAHQRQQLINLQQQTIQQQQNQQQQLHDNNNQPRQQLLDTFPMQTNNMSYNTTEQTAFPTADSQESMRENETNTNMNSNVLSPADVTTSTSVMRSTSTDSVVTETSTSLSLITESTTTIDSGGIENILPGSTDDLDDFLNNPSDKFDLYSLF